MGPDSLAAGRLVRELTLPDGAVMAMISRARQLIPPRGSTPIRPGDYVFVVLRPEVRPLTEEGIAGRGQRSASTHEWHE